MTHGQCDARPIVTFPAAGHHWPCTGIKNTVWWQTHVCEQLAQCYLKAQCRDLNPRLSESQVQRPSYYVTRRHMSEQLWLADNDRITWYHPVHCTRHWKHCKTRNAPTQNSQKCMNILSSKFCSSLLRKTYKRTYTVSRKTSTFYFWNNSVKN